MADERPSSLLRATRLQRQISGLMTALDIDLLGKQTSKTVEAIKQLSNDARLDIRDWEMAESRLDMTQKRQLAQESLENLRAHVLKASEHGIFSSIDVIDLSAQIDGIMADLL